MIRSSLKWSALIMLGLFIGSSVAKIHLLSFHAAVVSALAVSTFIATMYFLVLNTTYLALVFLAARECMAYRSEDKASAHDSIYALAKDKPISVLLPAFNESATIVQSVTAALALRYPCHEIVVIDDGSTDDSFDKLHCAFNLTPSSRYYSPFLLLDGLYEAVVGGVLLLVARKPNGGKADALNVGISLSTYDWVSMVDGDSMLLENALLTVARPMLSDARVVAVGGVVLPANDSDLLRKQMNAPRSWLARIQVSEYLRAFLLGRMGWSKLDGLLVISGAFGIYHKDKVVAVGGLDPDTRGEDAELVLHMHRDLAGSDYKISFVSSPVCFTLVPENIRALAKQRARWHRGLVELTRKHSSMILDPNHGRIGLVALPFSLVFELLAPVFELFGILSVLAGVLFGLVDVRLALMFLGITYGFSVIVSLSCVAAAEYSFDLYDKASNHVIILIAAVLENLGYRQLTAVWRCIGIVQAFRGKESAWGETKTRQFAVCN
jgi:cellulose synthase/poly-beta-1,6-N-acetylglucosamine synthase-like glycosyltransferase